MKKLLSSSLFILAFIFVALYVYFDLDDILRFYRDTILKERDNITIEKNEYYRDYDFAYVQNTDNFIVKNEQQLHNVFYTILNSGVNNFTFFCDYDYSECLNKVEELSNDKNILSNINNFVHPYNSFSTIETSYNETGKVNVVVTHTYTLNEINKVNEVINSVISSKITNTMTEEQKIKTLHDYIIEKSEYGDTKSKDKAQSIAYGNLINGIGICGGYTDSMAIFLDKLKIKNYKISSEDHIWNLVYTNNSWSHLDLTWDDPINSNNSSKFKYLFFLINTSRLKILDNNNHNFDNSIFVEAN